MLTTKDDIILRAVHGTFFLVDITDHYFGNRCALYEINETGKFLWEHMDECQSIERLARLLQKEIVDEVSYEVLLEDVREYVNDLKRRAFVQEVDAVG